MRIFRAGGLCSIRGVKMAKWLVSWDNAPRSSTFYRRNAFALLGDKRRLGKVCH